MAAMSLRVAVALVPSAAGILVAVPAVWSHNYLIGLEKVVPRSRNALLYVENRFRETKQFSELPAFALLAGVLLTIAYLAFSMDTILYPSLGLPIHLRRENNFHDRRQVIVELSHGKAGAYLELAVDAKRVSFRKLADTVRGELDTNPPTVVQVEAGDDATWADIADVIDVLNGVSSEIDLHNQTRAKNSRRNKPVARRIPGASAVVLSGSTRFASRIP